MKKIILYTLLAIAGCPHLLAQYYTNQNKIWECGAYAGIDFTSGSPVAISGSIDIMEGCASVSSTSGSLQFYTDGLTVWDATGAVMPSGGAIVSFGTYSTTQGALIVPVLGNPNQYYIFSLETFDYRIAGNCNLAYSIVDMTLHGGLGDVISAGNALGSGMGEKMTAIAGNNCNIWVMVHDRDNPIFYAYSVDASGVSLSPVSSSVGTYTSIYSYAMGVIKASPDRSKIVNVPAGCAANSELFDFDPGTGIVSNCQVLNFTGSGAGYGAEFSPNSGLLYIATTDFGFITQLDVTLGSTAAIVASANVIGSTSGYYGDLKLGPDSKIYVTTYIYNNIDCITSPNTYGSGCTYTTNVLAGVSMTSILLGFPNIVISDPTAQPILGTLNVCVGWTTNLSDATGGGTWSSSDNTIATVGSMTGTVTGVSAGTATISYTTSFGCVATAIVTVGVTPAISGSPALCVMGSTTLMGSPNTGSWSGSTAIASVVNTGTPGQGLVSGLAQGTAVLTYTAPRIACPAIITVSVDVPAAINGPNQVCVGSSVNLTSGSALYGTWSSSNNTRATVGSSSGIVTGVAAGIVTISYTNGCGVYTYTMTVNTTPTISGTAIVCKTSTTTLTGSPSGGLWSGSSSIASVGSVSGVVTGLSLGTTTLTYTLSTGCFATVIVTVDVTPVISGPHTVCVGSAIGLSSGGASYGLWSSSNISVATVGSLSGIVTGVAGGVVNITYVNVCRTVTYRVTVNALPIITGTTVLCPSATTTLNATPPGGVWSGSSVVATVGSSSGVVTAFSGVSGGTAVLTYTDPAGCASTVTVTVSPATPPIQGPTDICIGMTIPMHIPFATGGTWTSSDITVAAVGSSSGMITGVAAGTATITYTDACGYSIKAVTVDWCCLTNALTLNTGYDPMSGTAVTPVSNLATPSASNTDPHWTVTNISTAAYYGISTAGGTAVTLGNPADVVNTVSGWAVFPGTSGEIGNWINCLNANYYYTDPSYGTDDYWETFTRTFQMCQNDNINIDINIACDNYCAGISIDGAAPYYTQPSPGVVGGLSTFISAPTGIGLAAGTHTISVTIVDYENSGVTIPLNYGGLGIWGSISSATSSSSLIREDDPYCGSYVCADGARHSNPVIQSIAPNGISLVPNPNNGTFALIGNLPETTSSSAKIEVMDMLGKTVYNDVAAVDKGVINKTITLGGNIANGVYMVRINTDGGNHVIRFTLNR